MQRTINIEKDLAALKDMTPKQLRARYAKSLAKEVDRLQDSTRC